jgi:acetyl-CoA synthetase
MERSMMRSTPIEKSSRPGTPEPNLRDYDEARASFSWEAARRLLSGLPAGRGLNMAHEAVDRHVSLGRGEHLALRFLGKDGKKRDLTYAELAEQTSRFANLLRRLGVGKGERVFALLPRVPELYVACLGTLKNGSVFSPLFSAFGPEPIALRIRLGEAKVLVTTSLLYARKVAAIRAALPSLEHVLVIPSPGDATPAGTLELSEQLASVPSTFQIPATDPEDTALLHFTSGTTGRPKGAIHVHGAVVAHHVTGALALDFHPDDVFWCTADPGWVTGTSYGILSPLTHGITSIVDEQDFDAERWYAILRDEKVNVWYTAPTAVRMLMRGGSDVARGFDMPKLHRQRRRAAQPGSGALGARRIQSTHSRQLVANGDGWDHDRQFRSLGHSPRLDGAPIAGRRGRHRTSRVRWIARDHLRSGSRGRARVATRLALHVSWLPE